MPDAIALLSITSRVRGFFSGIRGNWWRRAKCSCIKAKPVAPLSIRVCEEIGDEESQASWQATTK